MMNFMRVGVAGALLAGLAAPAMAATVTTDTKTVETKTMAPRASKSVAGIIATDSRFTILNQALKATGLDRTLDGTQVLTLYAPTNDAFNALPAGQLSDLMKPENKARLAAVLQGHVVAGRVPASAIADRRVDRTLSGTDLAYALPQGGGGGMGQARPMVGGAGILEADLAATNGVIHVIDRVILPQSMTPTAPLPR